MIKIPINDGESLRARRDILFVYYSNYYINEKSYLLRTIENLYNLGYYKNSESLFKDNIDE